MSYSMSPVSANEEEISQTIDVFHSYPIEHADSVLQV